MVRPHTIPFADSSLLTIQKEATASACAYSQDALQSSFCGLIAKSITRPILTYGGKGTLKRGVHADDHAIIYTGDLALKKGEKLRKKAIKMIPNSPRHHLDPASRINYAKLYTVEHNVKVDFIGTIYQKHKQQLISDYNNTHRPLPDRPDRGDTTEEDFGHSQGADPYWPGQTSAASSELPYSSSYAGQTDGARSLYPVATTSYEIQTAPTYSSNLISSYAYAPQTQTHGYQTEHGGGAGPSQGYEDLSEYLDRGGGVVGSDHTYVTITQHGVSTDEAPLISPEFSFNSLIGSEIYRQSRIKRRILRRYW
jgi:hypothetical protein